MTVRVPSALRWTALASALALSVSCGDIVVRTCNDRGFWTGYRESDGTPVQSTVVSLYPGDHLSLYAWYGREASSTGCAEESVNSGSSPGAFTWETFDSTVATVANGVLTGQKT